MGNSQARSLDDDIVLLLKDRDWSVRQTACVTLGQLPADEIVKLKDHIVPLLKDTHWSVRKSAFETLGTLPADEIVKLKDHIVHIVPLLTDTRYVVRLSACVTLGQLPADEIVKLKDHIVPLLKDTHWSVRKSAFETLGTLPADEIVKLKDHIVPLLKHTDWPVRRSACVTLGKLPADEIVKLKDHIVPLLKDTDELVREIACVTLEKLPADEIVKLKDHIVPLLNDTSGGVRFSACETLGKFPADEIVKLKGHIVPLLKDTDGSVRESACETLGKFPAKEIVKLKDHIVPLLKDTDCHVRSNACATLGKLPADEIVKLKDHIVPLLKDTDWSVHRYACATLGKLPADEIVKLKDHIVPLLKDTDWSVRKSAFETLGTLPADEIVKLKDHIVPLLKDTDSDVRRSAWVTLEKLPADEIVKLKDHIVPLLKDEDWHVRLSACETLTTLPADELVKLKDHIVPLLKDTSVNVRSSACEALGKLPADELVKLKDHIVPLLKDTRDFVRSSACQTLRTLPADELVKFKDDIVPLLNDTSGGVRANACQTLGKLAADELVELIAPLMLRKGVRKGAFALFGQLEVTKDLISLVEKLRPALLLHFAAAAGDWSACSLLLRSGFSAEEKDSDGRTPSKIARREGHLDLAERLKSDFLNTKGGSGMAIARALQDDNQIETVSWYTMPLSGWASHFGGQHSVLVVKVKDFTYAIERARPYQGDLIAFQKDEIQQATGKGLFVSDWEEVKIVPHLIRLQEVAPLKGADIKLGTSPSSLVIYLFSFDGYDVGRNNCHHTAMEAFNFCTESRQMTSLPVNLWQSFVAKVVQFLGSDLANGRSASGACASEPLYDDVIRHPLITGSKPTEWSSDGQKKEYLQEVGRGSAQYQKVKDFVMKFGGNKTEIPGFKIEKIYRNENFGSYKKYVQHLEDKTAQHEYCWLFHGPGGQQGFQKIVEEGRGFDDDFRSMTFAAYGQGHHFALDFRLADFFAEGRSQHEPKKTRRVFLCRVAAGKPFDAKRLFPYRAGDPKSGQTNEKWTEKMEEFNKTKPEGHDNSWFGDGRELIVGKGEMVYVDYVVEYTSAELAGNPYSDPLMKEIRKIPRPRF